MNATVSQQRFSMFQAFCRQQSAKGDDQQSEYHWVGRRYCEDDFILCVWLYRIRRRVYEVGLFAAEDHVRFVRGAGIMGGLVFILSDAYFTSV